MKRLLTFFISLVIMAALAIVGGAAESVIYVNTFSDASTLADFEQYGYGWEIKDGRLYMTDTVIDATSEEEGYGYIFYKDGAALENYTLEVDLMNVRTIGGVILRAHPEHIGSAPVSYCGYRAYVMGGEYAAGLGVGKEDGGEWYPFGGTKSFTDISVGADVRIRMSVIGHDITVSVINRSTGATIYTDSYTLGGKVRYDPLWFGGTFGLCMRMQDHSGTRVNANTAYFDNLVIRTAEEHKTEEPDTEVVPTPKAIDVTNLDVVYSNTFDSNSDIDDFYALYGEWGVKDGRLYLTDVEDAASALLVYNGDESLTKLGDYVLDVDIYNVQTQNGVVIRSQLDKVIDYPTDSGADFYGYVGYIGYSGNQAAMGFCNNAGEWGGIIDGDFVSRRNIFQPGSNLHIQLAVKGTDIQITVISLDTGKLLWTDVRYHDLWSEGTFGFRTAATVRSNGLDNVNNTAFDNLVISVFSNEDNGLVDASNGGVYLGSNNVYRLEDALSAAPKTVEAALFFDADTSAAIAGGTIFGNYHQDATTSNVRYAIGTGGNPFVEWKAPTGKSYKYTFDAVNVYNGEWIDLAITRDTASGTLKCYVNGILEQTLSITAVIEDERDGFVLGGDRSYHNLNYFKGRLKSVKVYSDVRTASEVVIDRNVLDKSDLLAAYDLSEAGDGLTRIADRGTRGNDAIRDRIWFDTLESPAADYAFSFAIVGDTQSMCYYRPQNFNKIYEWIYDNIEDRNIQMVIGLGDITEHYDGSSGYNVAAEWETALEGIGIIDGHVPHILLRGNHDSLVYYNEYMMKTSYPDIIDGRYSVGNRYETSYVEMDIGGIPYLFINFDWGVFDTTIEWAKDVIEQHPNHNVIISRHAYSYHDGTTIDSSDSTAPSNLSGGSYLDGDEMWDTFVKQYENIVMVLSGHIGSERVVVSDHVGVHGNVVKEVLIDFQTTDKIMEDGTGTVVMMHFSKDGKIATVETYSTVQEKYLLDSNQFTMQLDLVTDTEYETLAGDADRNGEVNVRDAATILQRLAGWDVIIDEKAADTDGDGSVSVRDAARILQYKAGWNVTLGK